MSNDTEPVPTNINQTRILEHCCQFQFWKLNKEKAKYFFLTQYMFNIHFHHRPELLLSQLGLDSSPPRYSTLRRFSILLRIMSSFGVNAPQTEFPGWNNMKRGTGPQLCTQHATGWARSGGKKMQIKSPAFICHCSPSCNHELASSLVHNEQTHRENQEAMYTKDPYV